MTDPSDPSSGELRPGDPTAIGRYRILARLGSGGMGTVYLADGGTGRVALKVVRPEIGDDPAFRTRFRREVQACFRIQARCTARLLDFDTEAEQPWMATEFVDGPSLDRLVAERGPLPPDQQLALAVGLAEALVAIHAAGVMHRDLKPANVISSSTGPKVIDFGISAAADASKLTSSGYLIGSPGWLAPEQLADSDVGPASDVFTVGLLLCFAASGQPPYGTGPTKAVMFRAMSQPPFLDRYRMAPALVPVVERAVAHDPRLRPTARQLLDELLHIEAATRGPAWGTVPGVLDRDWRAAPPAGPPPTPTRQLAGPPTQFPGYGGYGPPPAAPPRRGRPRWLLPVAAAAGALLVAAGAVGVLALSGDDAVPVVDPVPIATVTPSAPATTPALAAPIGAYQGTTSQGLPLAFEVTPDGQVGTVVFDERVTCSNTTGPVRVPFRGLPTTRGPLDSGGVFNITVQLPEQTFRMQGSYAGGQFRGALRHVYNGDATGNLTLGTGAGKCDSNEIRFTAGSS